MSDSDISVESEGVESHYDKTIKQKIDTYLDQKFGKEPLNMFYSWNFDQMVSESRQWMIKKECLYIYVIANHCPKRRLHARVGCTGNLSMRLLQCNGVIKGGPQGTKKAAGSWRLIFWLRIPPIRNYSSKSIKAMISEKRGWKSKCYAGISIADWMGLEWKVSKSVKDEASSYFSTKIQKLIDEKNCSNNDIYF